MPEPHKRAYRHPKYTTAYRVTNWPEYDNALRDRGDSTLWISHDASDAWTPPPNGKRGAQPLYATIAGEWHSQKHGEKKVKRWRKRHIGVDDQGHIVASTVTESHEQDPSHVPALLDQIEEDIGRFIADGIFDQEPVDTAVAQHAPGARVIIPPRKDAVVSPTASSAPTQRDQHLLTIEHEGRFAWKRRAGSYAQSHAENTFSRFKRTFGDRLRTKRDASQKREASLACQLLNRMRELGRPLSYPVR